MVQSVWRAIGKATGRNNSRESARFIGAEVTIRLITPKGETEMKVKFAVLMQFVFTAGFLVCANLSRLLEVGESYEAAWWKVGFAVFLAIMFASMAWRCRG